MHPPSDKLSDRPRIRLHRIRVPVQSRRLLYLAFLCVAGFALFLLVLAITLALIVVLGGGPWFMGISLPFGIVVTALLLRRIDDDRRRSHLQPTELRGRRLAELLNHPQALERLPHRYVEHELRSCVTTPARLRAVAGRLKPGTFVYVSDRAETDRIFPAPSDMIFEPLAVNEWDDNAVDVANAIETNKSIESGDEPAGDSGGRPHRKSRKSFNEVIAQVIGLIVIGLMFINALRNMFLGKPSSWAQWILIAFLVATPWLARILVHRRWWVIPGGLVTCDYRLWWKSSRITRPTPADSALIVYAPLNLVTVAHENHVASFEIDPPALWILTATWLGAATPPSPEQLEAFITSATLKRGNSASTSDSSSPITPPC